MGFTLDKLTGTGNSTIKVTVDVNTSTEVRQGQILVQVKGVTKKIITLTQKAAEKIYEPWIEVSPTQVPASGGTVRVNYGLKDKATGIKLNMSEWPGEPILQTETFVTSGSILKDTSYLYTDVTIPAYESMDKDRNLVFMAVYKMINIKATVVQKAKVEESITVYIHSDNLLIPEAGGEFTLHYGAVTLDGTIITDGVVLELVNTDTDTFDCNELGEGTDAEGKWVRYGVPANGDGKIKMVTFKATKGSDYNTLNIRQLKGDAIPLPEFDFFVFSFDWEKSAGKDLDSATFVEGTGLSLPWEPSDVLLDDIFVGFSGNNSKFEPKISEYIEWAGDNITSGMEGSNVKLKNICKDLSPDRSIIKIQIYANFYLGSTGVMGTGDMTLKVKTYKGDNMVLDKPNHTFIPDENTSLVSEEIIPRICLANCVTNQPNGNISNVRDKYTHLCTVEYDVKSKVAIIIPEERQTGRSVREYINVTVNNSKSYELECSGDGSATLPSLSIPKSGDVTVRVEFTDVLQVIDDYTNGNHWDNVPTKCEASFEPTHDGITINKVSDNGWLYDINIPSTVGDGSIPSSDPLHVTFRFSTDNHIVRYWYAYLRIYRSKS